MTNFFRPDPKKYSEPKVPKTLKNTPRKPTGELAMFKEIFLERKGVCEITGRKIEFHPISFMHVLSKGAYPSLRLLKRNIFMVIPDIHHIYDNGSREYLLHLYPKAKIIFERKEKLKIEANAKPETL